MAIESLGVDRYLRKLVENDKKSHKEVSILLRQAYPGVDGLSERSEEDFARNTAFAVEKEAYRQQTLMLLFLQLLPR